MNPRTSALILGDLQNDFLHPDGAYGRARQSHPSIAALPEKLAPLARAARERGVLIVATLFTLVPGRGAALTTTEQVAQGLAGTRSFISDMLASVQAGVAAGKNLNQIYKDTYAALKPKYGHWVIFDHCLPFDVTRCYDEATQYADPRIWTAERDIEMWKTLEA